jgi:fumarate reductase flavoprotein subunit
VKIGSIRAVAAALKLDADTLEQTLAAYNAAAAGKATDAAGRTNFGNAPLVGPYSGVRVTGGLFHTQGGLLVDAKARVLRQDGHPIANLYAAGGTAVGVSGSDGGRGYCSANGLLAALGLGRIAGRDAAEAL